MRRALTLLCLLLLSCARYDATQTWLGLYFLRPRAVWWNQAWRLRRPVSITNTGGTLSVPVLVKLTEANFSFSAAKADGKDVCFADASGAQLASERDVFTSTDAAFWVRVSLPNGLTTIYVYYGSAADCPSAGNVWSDYRAVYHLSQDPAGSVTDSANSNHLTATAMTAANLTSTNSTRGLSFNGTTQYLTAPDSATLQITGDASLEVYFFANPYSANAHYLVEKGDNDFDNYALYLKNSGAFGCAAAVGCAAFEFRDAGSSYFDHTGTFSMTHSANHYLAANLSDAANQIEFYVDGSLAETLAASLPGNTWPQPLGIGKQNFGASTYLFAGVMDEVRISAVTRSSDYYLFVSRNLSGLAVSIGTEDPQCC